MTIEHDADRNTLVVAIEANDVPSNGKPDLGPLRAAISKAYPTTPSVTVVMPLATLDVLTAHWTREPPQPPRQTPPVHQCQDCGNPTVLALCKACGDKRFAAGRPVPR